MAAYEARNSSSCASEQARKLFARAAQLGQQQATYHLAESYDPLKCNAPSANAQQAAELYRARAEAGAQGSGDTMRDAVLAWAQLVEKGLASPAPFKAAADMLHHYGSVLLHSEYQTDKGVALLKLAFVRGSEEAYRMLRLAADGLAPVASAKWLNEKAAAYELAKALRERFPSGERDQEITDLLIRSGYAFAAFEVLEPRLLKGTLDERAQIWFLSQLPEESGELKSDAKQVVERLLSNLTAPHASAKARETASAYLYRAAADALHRREVPTIAEWGTVLTLLERAFATDPSAARAVRHADALYAAVANVSVVELKDARTEALRRVAALYAAHRNDLPTAQLARSAMLNWHGLGPSRSPESTRSLFEALAAKGDAAARNTLRLAQAHADLFQPTTADFVAAIDEFASSGDDSEMRGGVCAAQDISRAIDSHRSLYRRLTASRGVPDTSRDIGEFLANNKLPLDAIGEGSGVAVFARDDLATCVWLLRRGTSSFEAVYLPSDFVTEQLGDFFHVEGIASAAKARAPIQRAARNGDLLSTLSARRGRSGNALRAVSLALFPGSVGEQLAELDALTVIPVGNIGVVPFAALPLNNTSALLVDSMTVSVAPNFVDVFAGSLGRMQFQRVVPGCVEAPRTSPQPAIPALVVGDPAYSADADFVFPQLPGARAEAQLVAQLLGTHALTGSAATLESVVEAAPQSTVLYFATHGVASEQTGLDGFVALAAGGRLTARSVQAMCLQKTKLAVLSACQTGLGQAVGGGVIGLARAFQIAGVPNVVMSLWSVDDAATQMLMTTFLTGIVSGAPTTEALRAAMLSVRATHPNPRYWASFTILSAGSSDK